MKAGDALRRCAIVVAIALIPSAAALAAQIDVDEQGHMEIDGVASSPGTLQTGPTYSFPVLTYTLPFPGNPGELVLRDPKTNAITDLINFPGDSTMEYLSAAAHQTTLAAAAAFGATNIKLIKTIGYAPGDQIFLDQDGANPERITLSSVGTPGAVGTGINFTPSLSYAHASGVQISEALRLADLLDLPNTVDPNVSLTEGAPTVWSPGATGIGGDASSPDVQYFFVPEPGAACLALLVAGFLLWRRSRRKLPHALA